MTWPNTSRKVLIILRFGNQGSAQAQNVRDSGIPSERIIIANREDHYAESAKSAGFAVEHDFSKAAAVADGIYQYHGRSISTAEVILRQYSSF